MQGCLASDDNIELSVSRYHDGGSDNHWQFFKKEQGKDDKESAYLGLKSIHDSDNGNHGFYLLSGEKWKLAPTDSTNPFPPLDTISFDVDFYKLSDLNIYFQNENTPGSNIPPLLSDTSGLNTQYKHLKTAFDDYVQKMGSSEGDEEESNADEDNDNKGDNKKTMYMVIGAGGVGLFLFGVYLYNRSTVAALKKGKKGKKEVNSIS